MRSKVVRVTVETVVPALVGVGLCAYVLLRVARGAARIAHEVGKDLVSG